jgi:hypothetical protein
MSTSDTAAPSTDDGRNPAWDADGPVLAMWESVMEHSITAADATGLPGPDVGRLRYALDKVHEAEQLLDLARTSDWAGKDIIAATAGLRSARKMATDLVNSLIHPTPSRPVGRPPKDGPTHGHRPQRKQQIKSLDDGGSERLTVHIGGTQC